MGKCIRRKENSMHQFMYRYCGFYMKLSCIFVFYRSKISNQKCFPFDFAKTSSNFVKNRFPWFLNCTASLELAVKNFVWILLFFNHYFVSSSPDPTTNYEYVIPLERVWLIHLLLAFFSSNNHIGLWKFRNKPEFVNGFGE